MKKFLISMVFTFALFLGINNNASASDLNNDLNQISTEIVTNDVTGIITNNVTEFIVNDVNVAPDIEAIADAGSIEIEIIIDKDGVRIRIKIEF